jgi:hypothetical protein
MFDLINPNTFWLNTINFAVALAILACCVVVGKGVYQDVRVWIGKRVHGTSDDHAFVLPGLGITMADGGMRLDGKSKDLGNVSVFAEDEENIFRSEN